MMLRVILHPWDRLGMGLTPNVLASEAPRERQELLLVAVAFVVYSLLEEAFFFKI